MRNSLINILVVLGLAIATNVVLAQSEEDEKGNEKKCYGIAFSDGADLGPYQAGVFAGLVEKLPLEEIAYTTVSGVTLGSLNAHILSQFQIGEEKDAALKLEKFWKDLANEKLYEQWHGGYLYGVFFQQSLYNADHLNRYIFKEFNDTEVYRHVNIGIANVLNGSFSVFDEKTTNADMLKVLEASVSFPGVFAPVEALDSLWFTGSAIQEIDVTSPINHCEKLGYDEADIIIDVILGGNPNLPHVFTNHYNAVQITARGLEIMRYYEMMFGLLKAKGGHPGVHFRYVIGPSESVASRTVPIDFTSAQADYLFNLGKKDALKAASQDTQANETQKKVRNFMEKKYYNKDHHEKASDI